MKYIKTSMLAFEVTRRCNQNCKHCLRGKSQNIDMTKEIIDKLFRNKDYKIVEMSHIVITGGEPTLVPDVIEYLIDTIIELDISITDYVNCITNGLIYSEKMINSINKLMEYLKTKENCKEVQLIFELSNDQYHKRPSKEVLNQYSKLPFLDESFLKPRTRTIESTLNEGNAKENGIGGSLTYKDIMSDINIKEENNKIEIGNELFVTSNGNIVQTGTVSFIEEDKIALGNINETSFLTILENLIK